MYKGLNSTEILEGLSTRPITDRLGDPHPCSVPATPRLRLLVPLRLELPSGEIAFGSSKSRWKIPPIQQAPSRESIEQLAWADIQPLANIQPGSGNDRCSEVDTFAQRFTACCGERLLYGCLRTMERAGTPGQFWIIIWLRETLQE